MTSNRDAKPKRIALDFTSVISLSSKKGSSSQSILHHNNARPPPTAAPRVSFFDLPPEVRTSIYLYALTRPETEPLYVLGSAKRKTSGLAIELLRTNTLIRKEALPVFLGANTFRIDCTAIEPERLQGRLRSIGASTLRMIRRYEFAYFPALSSSITKSAERCERTLVQLQLVPSLPFYTVSGTHVGVAEVKNSGVAYFLKDMFMYRGVRSLTIRDVLDIACFVHGCGYSWTLTTIASELAIQT
jgi:hypothetical protein